MDPRIQQIQPLQIRESQIHFYLWKKTSLTELAP